MVRQPPHPLGRQRPAENRPRRVPRATHLAIMSMKQVATPGAGCSGVRCSLRHDVPVALDVMREAVRRDRATDAVHDQARPLNVQRKDVRLLNLLGCLIEALHPYSAAFVPSGVLSGGRNRHDGKTDCNP